MLKYRDNLVYLRGIAYIYLQPVDSLSQTARARDGSPATHRPRSSQGCSTPNAASTRRHRTGAGQTLSQENTGGCTCWGYLARPGHRTAYPTCHGRASRRTATGENSEQTDIQPPPSPPVSTGHGRVDGSVRRHITVHTRGGATGGAGGADCPPNCRTWEQYYVFAPADFLEAP